MYKKIIFRFLLFYSIFLLALFILRRNFDIGPEILTSFVERLGSLAPIAYSILLFLGLSVPFNPLSELVLINVAAFSFNLPTAIIATFCGHSLSIIINYFLGKKFGWKIIKKSAGKNVVKKVEILIGKISYKNVFILRWILPINAIFGIDILSYLSGLTKLSFKKYYLVSIIPWTVLNILFFTLTKQIITTNQYLFFLPALLLITLPGIALLLIRKVKS